MKYFTYDLISAANDWIEQTQPELLKAEERLASKFKDYLLDLESLKPRISAAAWQFFRHGFGHFGLHDARLLSLCVGDGLNYTPDGALPFLLNRQRASAIIEFLNYEQDFHYIFDLRGVSRVISDLFVEEESPINNFGDLYIYELTAVDEYRLQLGFLFASGASVLVQFKKLVFRRNRIKRKYETGEMYR